MHDSRIHPPRGSIDCHAHVFARGMPLATGARYAPERDALPLDYRALLDAHGLDGGVLVQPSVLGTDNAYLLAAVASAPSRLRAIAVVARDARARTLDALARGGVVGIRANLVGAPHRRIEEAISADLLSDVVRRGWHVEVQADGPHWPQVLPPLLARGARVVVDHFGRPSEALGAQCPGFHAILHAAKDHDVWVKLSAPYRFDARHAAQCARMLLDRVGADRLVWGSDWPWTQHPEVTRYAATLQWFADWIPDVAARRRVLASNAQRLFGFTPRT